MTFRAGLAPSAVWQFSMVGWILAEARVNISSSIVFRWANIGTYIVRIRHINVEMLSVPFHMMMPLTLCVMSTDYHSNDT